MSSYDKYALDNNLPDGFCKRSDLLAQNVILPFMDSSLYIKDESLFNYLTEEDTVEYIVYGEKISVSNNLLRLLLSKEQEDGFLAYFLTNLNTNSPIGIILCLLDDQNRIRKSFNLTKSQMSYILSNKLDSSIKPNYSSIYYCTKGIEAFAVIAPGGLFQIAENSFYSCEINGQKYKAPVRELIQLLTISKSDYIQCIKNKKQLSLPIGIMAYMLVNYFESEDILNKFLLNKSEYDRFMSIKNFVDIDYESLYSLKKSDDINEFGESFLDDVPLNPELIEAITKDLNPEYSPAEKALYIYIRLCDLLTYDEQLLAKRDSGERTGEHYDLSNISNITPENNKVVTYEFMIIYAKFLKVLKVPYSIKLNSFAGYTNSKSQLTFKQGEFIVEVNLFTDYLKNDMSNIKMGSNLEAINCLNKNAITRKKFNEVLYGVYKRYLKDSNRRKEFEEGVETYKREYLQDVNIPKKEKLFMLLKLIGRKDLVGIDSINYVRNVFNCIKSDDEDIDLAISLMKMDSVTRPIYIISLFENNNFTYYICDPLDIENVKYITREELLDKINNNELNIMDGNIKGIKEGVSSVRETKNKV